MATQIVELTGDEAKLLRSLDKIIQKEREHERQLSSVGAKGGAAGDDIAKSMQRAGDSSDKEVGKLLRQLGRVGPQGKAAADQLKKSFADQGKFGFSSDGIIGELEKVDAQAAETAREIVDSIEEADRETAFNETLKKLKSLGGESETVASIIEQEIGQAAEDSAESMDAILAKLQELKPEANLSAEAIEARMKEASEASKREFEKTIQTLRDFGPEGKKVADRLEREMEQAGDASEQSIEGIINKLDGINPAAAKSARSIHREVERNANRAEGSVKGMTKAVGREIASIAGSFAGVHEAVQFWVSLNEKVIATNKEAFQQLRGTEDADRRLVQVADEQDSFTELRDRADTLSSDYGIGRVEARNLVFQGKSDRFLDALDFIASNDQVVDVNAQATVASRLPSLFKNDQLTPQQAINATLAAAQQSNLDFEQIASVTPSAAEGGSLAQASADETLGSLAVLSTEFKSGDTAADRLKALGTRIGLDQGGEGRESVAGLGFIDAVEQILSLPEAQQRDFAGGSQEINSALKAFEKNLDQIKQRTEAIRQARLATGTDASPTAIGRAEVQSDPKSSATLRARIAAIRKDIATEERRAVTEGQRQAAADTALAQAEREGVSKRAIATAETVQDYLGPLSGTEFSGELVTAASELPLDNLFRDVSFASRRGNEEAKPAALLIKRLINDRIADPNAIVSQDAAADFLRGTTGDQEISPVDITDQQRLALTRAVFAQAQQSRGLERTASTAVLDFTDDITGGNLDSVPFLRLAGQGVANEGQSSAVGIQQRFANALSGRSIAGDLPSEDPKTVTARLAAAIERQNELIAEGNEINRKQAESNERSAAANERTAEAASVTAGNTTPTEPEPTNYGQIQRGRQQ
jgi:hypothetical protein